MPFSIKKLWYELDRFERVTFRETAQTAEEAYPPDEVGDANQLRHDRYPAASPYNQAPYKNTRRRNIERHLDLMRSRLKDGQYSFLFSSGGGFEPSLDGKVQSDLDSLIRDWVGHDRPITIFDVSGLPSDVLPTIVGTMLRVIYHMLFWGAGPADRRQATTASCCSGRGPSLRSRRRRHDRPSHPVHDREGRSEIRHWPYARDTATIRDRRRRIKPVRFSVGLADNEFR